MATGTGFLQRGHEFCFCLIHGFTHSAWKICFMWQGSWHTIDSLSNTSVQIAHWIWSVWLCVDDSHICSLFLKSSILMVCWSSYERDASVYSWSSRRGSTDLKSSDLYSGSPLISLRVHLLTWKNSLSYSLSQAIRFSMSDSVSLC